MVHFDGDSDGTLFLYTQKSVSVWREGVPILKAEGGSFDDVEAYSPKVEEFLTNQKQISK